MAIYWFGMYENNYSATSVSVNSGTLFLLNFAIFAFWKKSRKLILEKKRDSEN